MKHNLNVIKEIKVTDSFLSMEKDIRGCQEESFDDCTTIKYKTAVLNDEKGATQTKAEDGIHIFVLG